MQHAAKSKHLLASAFAALAVGAIAAPAHALQVITPVEATVEAGGDAGEAFSIYNTFDQSGLSEGYEGGLTDYDEFLAAEPLHSASGSYREWFAEAGATMARVTFDFGSVFKLSSLALWNEEAGGVGKLKIYAMDQLLGEFSPTDNASGVRFYGFDRFDFSEVSTRYLTFEMEDCGGAYAGCSMGEVAFGGIEAVAGAVPEPATWAMLILGFFGIGGLLRRRGATLQAI